MFEALVRTVDAIEPTVCVEALASLCMAKSSSCFSVSALVSIHSFWSNSSRLFLMQNLQTKNVTIMTTTTPPMTPPAMGPAADGDFGFVGAGALDWAELAAAPPMHCVLAHWSQFLPIKEHISPAAQSGHDGEESGQVTHRLNRLRPIMGKSAGDCQRDLSAVVSTSLTDQKMALPS